jgi:tetratricopeptide (TPR) repeat protein
MNDNTKALKFYEIVYYNLRKHPRLKQPNLGIIYYSMGQIYKNIQQTDKAMKLYRKAIEFEQKTTFPDNFKLQLYRKHLAEAEQNNIASTYSTM